MNVKDLTLKINYQLNINIKELNNIRKQFGLAEIDYINGIYLREINDHIQEVKESIKEYINNSNYIYKKERLIQILDDKNTDIKRQTKYIKYILESIEYYRDIYEQLEDVILETLLPKSESNIIIYFYNRGWVFSNRVSPKDILVDKKIYNKFNLEELDAETLDKIILLYFKNRKINLCKIIKSWNKKEFNNRKHIFDECMWAINNKKYAIAITTLIIQIEGVLYDRFSKIVKKSNKDWWQVKQSFNYAFNKSDNNCKHLKLMLEDDVYAMFDKSFLDKSWKGNGYKTHTNRNEIVHGIDIKYNNEITLIKIVMLLDAIHDIL